MDEKQAFPGGPEHLFMSGMTFDEWQWTQFAKHPPSVDEKWILGAVVGCTREDFIKYHVRWAMDYADAMMAAIAKREQERGDV